MKTGFAFLFVALAVITSNSVVAQSDDQTAADLAKQLQNPVANLISVPFQNNVDFNLGPNDDGVRYLLNLQPVIPAEAKSNTPAPQPISAKVHSTSQVKSRLSRGKSGGLAVRPQSSLRKAARRL